VYGSDTETKNILSIAVKIEGEDDTETKFKYLTNKAKEGYEMFIMSSADLAGFRSRVGGGGWGVEVERLRGLLSHLFANKIRGLV